MRYFFPVLMILSIVNLYHVVKPVDGDGSQSILVSREYRFSMDKDLELMKAQDEIQILKTILNRYREANTHRLRLSAYTARPEECNDDVQNTAVMETPKPGLTVAVSRDLKGWLGKRVYVEGFGVRLVNDLMHPRYTKSIDILVGDVALAREIGVRQDVLVALIEPMILDKEGIDVASIAFWKPLH